MKTVMKHFRKSYGMRAACIADGAGRDGGAFLCRGGLRGYSAGWILAGILAVLLSFPLPASATSPSDVQLSYLEQEDTLQVTITHNSYLPGSHYIKRVEIQKNSEKPMVQEYTGQPDKATFTYRYKLSLKEGDRVEVKAICNLYGSRSASLVITGPAAK